MLTVCVESLPVAVDVSVIYSDSDTNVSVLYVCLAYQSVLVATQVYHQDVSYLHDKYVGHYLMVAVAIQS